jgi:site-specific recombinase XerD
LSNKFVELLVAVGLHRPHAARKKTSQGRSVRRMASELSFHSLRHTAVSLLKDAGIPQAVVQELIGHRSAEMSALYTHVGQEALRKATSALPAL